MSGPYTYANTSEGVSELKDKFGSIVPEDAANQAFWDFATWNSHQEDPLLKGLYQLSQKSYVFSDLGKMIDHFKKWESLIYVGHSGDSKDKNRIVDAGKEFHYGEGGHRLISVPKAVAGDSDSEFEYVGWGGNDKSGLVQEPSNTWMTEALWHELNEKIKDDAHDVRKISTWPIERCFVYFDVSDFSRMPPGHQVLVINSIVHTVDNDPYWAPSRVHDIREDMEARICIGDGYIFVFRNALKATRFAAYLAHLTETLIAKGKIPVDYHFRMGVHVGRVYCFWDPGRDKWNYIGDGINGGQRVLGAVGKDTDDVMFVSAQIRRKIAAEPESDWRDVVLDRLHNRGRRADKHGNPWRVYEVSHTGLMSGITNELTL